MPTEIASGASVSYQDELWVGRYISSAWVYTQVFGVETVAMPEKVPEEVDVTHQQSPGRSRETMPGLFAAADMSQELQLWAGDASQAMLDTLASLTEAGTPETIRIVTVVGGITRTYRAQVQSFIPQGTVGDKRGVTVAFKVFERITPNPVLSGMGSAPVNQVPPYIMGTATIGQTLTAWEGKWTGATNFSFQWKADGTNISGATGVTLVLASAQSGKAITVAVTATNAAGSASATSPATSAVS